MPVLGRTYVLVGGCIIVISNISNSLCNCNQITLKETHHLIQLIVLPLSTLLGVY